MAIITYPLNDVKYNAQDAESHMSTRTSGVLNAPGNFELFDIDGDGGIVWENIIRLAPGYAWINNGQFKGKSITSYDPTEITLPIADPIYPRHDLLVLRFDVTKNSTSFEVVQGIPADNPSAPQPTRNDEMYELGLYVIKWDASQTSIRSEDIINVMGDDAYCGYIRDLVKNGEDGKSAYEIAVENGFEGTEEEWVASLQTDTGISGSGHTLEDGVHALKNINVGGTGHCLKGVINASVYGQNHKIFGSEKSYWWGGSNCGISGNGHTIDARGDFGDCPNIHMSGEGHFARHRNADLGGLGNNSSAKNQTVRGTYAKDNPDALLIIGCGTKEKDKEAVRKNAFEVVVEDNVPFLIIGDTPTKAMIVTPQMFGAKGDGTTDDTNALQRAFAYAVENKAKCFIPKGIYKVTPKTSVRYTDGWTYTYCFDVPSDLNIEGANRDAVVFKVDEAKTYSSVFCSYDVSDYRKNITIKNITIEQDYESASDDITNSGRNNMRNVFALYSPSENVRLENIYFKNCCGVDPVLINNYETTNVALSNCKFDYRHVRNVAHYDRSVVYMECCNYLVENNEVNGNFETLGGIELHGYNGTCRNNRIRDCMTAIHIAPRYKTPIEAASIWVFENFIKDSCFGIQMWKNTHENATKGFEGVYITDNKIDVDCSIAKREFFFYEGVSPYPSRFAGISAETYMDTIYKDVKISNNSIVYHGARDYPSIGSELSFGIGIHCPSDIDSVVISNNYIEGCYGNGVAMGYYEDNLININNVEIAQNIIKNCGRRAATNAIYQAYIWLAGGNKSKVVIKGNILEKTDTEYNVWASFYNESTAKSIHKDVYFRKDNLTSSPIEGEMFIANLTEANIIYEEGPATLLSTIAKKGCTFFDIGTDQMLVYTGMKWAVIYDGEYELLQTLTTEEEQGELTFNIAPCSEVLCKLTVPHNSNPAGGTAYVGINTNFGMINGLYNGIQAQGMPIYWTVRIFPQKGFYSAETTEPSIYDNFGGKICGMAPSCVNVHSADLDITSVSIWTMDSNVKFPAGTVVEVWGIKK